MSQLEIVGRSSSHFTRIAQIFARELGVPYTFRPLLDLTSVEPADYAGNPALKIPILVDADGPLFGTENICRELARRSIRGPSAVMRGDVGARVVANAEELTLHAMSTEVSLVMARMANVDGASPKLAQSLERSLGYLDENVDALVAALPEGRTLSFCEVALYCLVTHLPFRQVMDVARFERLAAFCERFGERESAQGTAYRFDKA